MHLKLIPLGPAAFEAAEVVIAFAIFLLVALFHECFVVLRASAWGKWISEGGGKIISPNMATFFVQLVAVAFGVWMVGVISHLRGIGYIIAMKTSWSLVSAKNWSQISLADLLVLRRV